MWGGIKPQFYCTHCGIVTNRGGRRDKSRPIPKLELKQAVDQTFIAINITRVPIGPFMEALRYTLGATPTLTVAEFQQYGYILKDGYLTRTHSTWSNKHDR